MTPAAAIRFVPELLLNQDGPLAAIPVMVLVCPSHFQSARGAHEPHDAILDSAIAL